MNIGYVRLGTEEEVRNQELETRRYADSKKVDRSSLFLLSL